MKTKEQIQVTGGTLGCNAHVINNTLQGAAFKRTGNVSNLAGALCRLLVSFVFRMTVRHSVHILLKVML